MDKSLLDKYFNGKCTPEEEALVSAYLQGENLQLLHEYIDEIAQHTQDELPQEKAAEQLVLLYSQTAPAPIPEKKHFLRRYTAIAAAAAILLCITVAAWLWQRPAGDTLVDWTTVDNPDTTKMKITMPDGTQIWLNAHAALSYDQQAYNREKRTVKISGEAFFDVAHNPQKPFEVQAGEVTTIVKGTAFNIEAYFEEKNVRVTLVRGSVEVKARTVKYIMRPGQLMNYDQERQNMNISDVPVEDVANWTDNRLVFNDLSLADALKRLEAYYNITIILKDSTILSNKRITAQYQRKNPDEVLTKLLFIHGLRFTKKGTQYLIK